MTKVAENGLFFIFEILADTNLQEVVELRDIGDDGELVWNITVDHVLKKKLFPYIETFTLC